MNAPISTRVITALTLTLSTAQALWAEDRDSPQKRTEGPVVLDKPDIVGPGPVRAVLQKEGARPGSVFTFSPDGKYLASIVTEWFPAAIDPKTGDKLAQPKG